MYIVHIRNISYIQCRSYNEFDGSRAHERKYGTTRNTGDDETLLTTNADDHERRTINVPMV